MNRIGFKKSITLIWLFMLIVLLFNPAFAGPENISDQHADQIDAQAANSYRADLAITGLVKGSSGRRINIDLTVTEMGSSSLGSILVLLPDLNGSAGFSNYRVNSGASAASSGKRWEAMIAERNGSYYLNIRAKSASDYLVINEQVTVSFSANVPAYGYTGGYQFKTRAWTDNSSRDALRTDPATGQPENLNMMAAGFNDPVIHVELPAKTGVNSYYYTTDRAKGLTAELFAEGNGFETTIFSTSSSVSFLTKLEMPAAHHYTTTHYRPDGSGDWSTNTVAENQPVDLLQGYTAGWQDYYHRGSEPGERDIYGSLSDLLKQQEELSGQNLSGLSEAELKALAGREGLAYYRSVLTAHSEQVWFAGVVLEPGAKGVLMKRINCAYGTTAHIFNDNNELWPSGRGYGGPSHGFGFVRDGDGYRVERGRDYPGNYIDIEQVADTSKGKVIRYIDVSSPFSGAYIREDMSVSGSGKVDEILSNVNIRAGAFLDWPGSAAFSDDWDLWIFPNNSLNSNVFNSPVFQAGQGSGGPGSTGDTAVLHPQETENDQARQEDLAIILPDHPQSGINEDELLTDETDGKIVEYAAELSRETSSTGVILLIIISSMIILTIAAIFFILTREQR